MSDMQNAADPLFDNDYTSRFQALTKALAQGDSAESARLVELIANPGSLSPTTRLSYSLRRWVAVFARDSYTCRYCDRQTIAPPVLRVVSHVFPAVFRFHPNWKTSETDASYFVLSTSADHVVPVTRGGGDEPSNLATACWTCNEMKGNRLLSEIRRWQLLPSVSTKWRGLTEYLEPMMEKAALQKDMYLRRWVDAIRNPESLGVATDA
jgi:hypothetical protein